MEKLRIFTLLSLILSLTSCDPLFEIGDYYYNVSNMSEDTICVYFAVGIKEWNTNSYPDTLLPENEMWRRSTGQTPYSNVLMTEQLCPPNESRYCYKMIYNNKYGEKLTKDTLSVIIISTDTLKKYGYEDVRNNYRILIRYDLDINYVREKNYHFVYPPSEEMRDMKMYPSYEQFYEWYNNKQ